MLTAILLMLLKNNYKSGELFIISHVDVALLQKQNKTKKSPQ